MVAMQKPGRRAGGRRFRREEIEAKSSKRRTNKQPIMRQKRGFSSRESGLESQQQQRTVRSSKGKSRRIKSEALYSSLSDTPKQTDWRKKGKFRTLKCADELKSNRWHTQRHNYGKQFNIYKRGEQTSQQRRNRSSSRDSSCSRRDSSISDQKGKQKRKRTRIMLEDAEPMRKKNNTHTRTLASAAVVGDPSMQRSNGGVTDFMADEAERLSKSKKRKLLAEVKLNRRNDEAFFMKQCFRLYSQLLAAPRHVAGDSLQEESPLKEKISIKDDSRSTNTDDVRGKLVQERVTALLNFVLPRIEKGDRHLCTSRSLQLLLKHGNKQQRSTIWTILKPQYVDLCCGRTTCQLAMKQYLYGDKECQQEIVQLLTDLKQSKIVFFSKCGARVWEYVYTALKSRKAQDNMLRPVMLPALASVRYPPTDSFENFSSLLARMDVQTKSLSLEHMATVIQTCVDKELLDKAPVHRLLKLYASVATAEQLMAGMQTLGEGLLNLASTKDGVEAMVTFLGYATARQRKSLIKEMRDVVASMATNPIDFTLVLRLLCTVDDTKLSREVLVTELLKNVRNLVFDPHGHLVILQLLDLQCHFSRHLPPDCRRLLMLPSPTSLKPLEVRLIELRAPVIDALEEEVVGAAATTLRHTTSDQEHLRGKKYLAKVLEFSGTNKAETKKDFSLHNWLFDQGASRILLNLLALTRSARLFEVLADYFSKDPLMTISFVDQPQLQRFLSSVMKLIQTTTRVNLSEGVASAENGERIESAENMFVKTLWIRIFKTHLPSLISNRGVFILNDMLQAVRRLHDKAFENDIIENFDDDALTKTRTELQEKGRSVAGLDLLKANLFQDSASSHAIISPGH